MSSVSANKCDCGAYIEVDEYHCVKCAVRDEDETAWWEEDRESWLLSGLEPDELQNVSITLANEEE